MARGKVAPPVTPRIVHAQPGQRLLKYSLLLIAMVLVAWFSYDRGKLQAPAGGGITVAQSRQAAERIEELEQERDALKLENVHIVGTDSVDLYRLGFSVMHEGDSGGRVAGTIWIAVNGLTNGQPTRLSLKTLSPERRAFVKMGFDLQQDVVQDVVLPEDFSPRNILIEAKPYGDRYTGAAETFAWATRD